MTISSENRKAGPYTGTGTTGPFPFAFKVFSASDVLVVRTDLSSVESTLTLTTDYTVSLNADQNANPGGNITLTSALASGYLLTMTSQVDYKQSTDLTNQGGFYPAVITNALDKLTILVQQLRQTIGRSLSLPLSAPSSVSTELPFPQASKVIGWNADADALQNYDVQDFASTVQFSNWRFDTFTGDGSAVNFNLSSNPVTAANTDVSISGVTQVPGTDYTILGTVISFTTAPAVGTKILVRYGTAAQQVVNGLSNEAYTATAGQTVFTLSTSYVVGAGALAVYLNGVRLIPGEDYTETGTTQVTLATGATVGDRLLFVIGNEVNEASSVDASGVGYLPAGAGAVATNVQSKLRESVSVKDFGAKGDGVTDDTAAIQAALAATAAAGGGFLYFDGVYRLTENAGASTQTRFSVTTGNTTLVFSERTKFLIKSDSGITVVFALNGISNFRTIGTLRVESDATTPYSTTGSYGAKALVIYNANGSTSANINIDKVHLTRGSGGVFISNAYASTNRVVVVSIGEIQTFDATYGFNAQNNGDSVDIGLLYTQNAYRSYFVYGCETHRVNVISRASYSSGTPVNITRYSAAEGGSAVNTDDINVDLMVSNGGSESTLVTLRHVGDGGATQKVSNIMLRIHTDFTPSVVLSLANFDTSGGSASATPFDAKIENVFVECNTPQASSPIVYSPCSWTTLPNVVWGGAAGTTVSQIRSYQSTVNFRTVKSGDQYLPDDLTFANNKYIYGYSTGGIQYRLAGVDASNNTLFGASNAAAVYSIVYGGSGGIYFNANGTTYAQVSTAGFRPNADNTYSLGTSGQRWSVVYAGTGTINTSDAREKQQVRSLSDAENAVAVRLKSLIKSFKFNDAVESKGDDARIHVGVIAQEVMVAFQAEGLDPMRYAIVCYDEWGAEAEELDADGNVVKPAREAGNRYGVRYEELLAFIIAAL